MHGFAAALRCAPQLTHLDLQLFPFVAGYKLPAAPAAAIDSLRWLRSLHLTGYDTFEMPALGCLSQLVSFSLESCVVSPFPAPLAQLGRCGDINLSGTTFLAPRNLEAVLQELTQSMWSFQRRMWLKEAHSYPHEWGPADADGIADVVHEAVWSACHIAQRVCRPAGHVARGAV